MDAQIAAVGRELRLVEDDAVAVDVNVQRARRLDAHALERGLAVRPFDGRARSTATARASRTSTRGRLPGIEVDGDAAGGDAAPVAQRRQLGRERLAAPRAGTSTRAVHGGPGRASAPPRRRRRSDRRAGRERRRPARAPRPTGTGERARCAGPQAHAARADVAQIDLARQLRAGRRGRRRAGARRPSPSPPRADSATPGRRSQRERVQRHVQAQLLSTRARPRPRTSALPPPLCATWRLLMSAFRPSSATSTGPSRNVSPSSRMAVPAGMSRCAVGASSGPCASADDRDASGDAAVRAPAPPDRCRARRAADRRPAAARLARALAVRAAARSRARRGGRRRRGRTACPGAASPCANANARVELGAPVAGRRPAPRRPARRLAVGSASVPVARASRRAPCASGGSPMSLRAAAAARRRRPPARRRPAGARDSTDPRTVASAPVTLTVRPSVLAARATHRRRPRSRSSRGSPAARVAGQPQVDLPQTQPGLARDRRAPRCARPAARPPSARSAGGQVAVRVEVGRTPASRPAPSCWCPAWRPGRQLAAAGRAAAKPSHVDACRRRRRTPGRSPCPSAR